MADGLLAVAAGAGRVYRAARARVRRPRRRATGPRTGRRRGQRTPLKVACPNRRRGCRHTDTPAGLLRHLGQQCRYVPQRGARQPGRGAGPFRGAGGARPAGGGRTTAAGLNQRINDLLAQMGPYMEEMRAAAQHLRRVGEAVDTDTLMGLIAMYQGLQAIGGAYAELIIDVADFADVELRVDPRALRHGWGAADQVTEALPALQQVISTVAQLYPGRLAAEQEAEESGGAAARPLNTDRMRPV